MSADFFERQDQARRSTAFLVTLFVLAVLGTAFLVYVVIRSALAASSETIGPGFFEPTLMAWTGLLTMGFIGLGSAYKVSQLSGGGRVVAELLGGQLLQDNGDPAEKRLRNVVEEMALASGVPVPPVYILEDRTINAFAAGHTPEDAVIGVTRGCMERLTRDELQGVVAHEFSHILNGDMRINLRLMGLIFGLTLITVAGSFLLRSSRFRTSRKGGANVLPLIGIGLLVAGSIGTFFGSMIRAAVSRQREYLADSSAVQFTRYPQGLAGALKKIGAVGSKVGSSHAAEASHLFFGKAVSSALDFSMATHPPLEKRIRLLDPSWDGTFPSVEQAIASRAETQVKQADRKGVGSGISLLAQMGTSTDAHLTQVRRVMAGVPEGIKSAGREPFSARALVFALLLDRAEEVRAQQYRMIEEADPQVAAETAHLDKGVRELGPEARLPLIDMAIPALKRLSQAQYDNFKVLVRSLSAADRKTSLFEWSLHKVLLGSVEPHFSGAGTTRTGQQTLKQRAEACQVLLSALARVGHTDETTATKAFDAGTSKLGIKLRPVQEVRITLADLDNAINALQDLAPLEKRQLLQACAACIAADKRVTSGEAELFRAMAESLHVPAPPLLPGQEIR
ncbi:MAG: M48 family metallopeptidase [Desulfovibrionales bacterium]